MQYYGLMKVTEIFPAGNTASRPVFGRASNRLIWQTYLSTDPDHWQKSQRRSCHRLSAKVAAGRNHVYAGCTSLKKIEAQTEPLFLFADLIGAAPEVRDAFKLMGVVISLCCECSRNATTEPLPGSGRAAPRSFMSRTLKHKKHAVIRVARAGVRCAELARTDRSNPS